MSKGKIKIKECPFCNGTGRIYTVVDFVNGEPEKRFGVECVICGARTPARDFTQSGALAFWNVRVKNMMIYRMKKIRVVMQIGGAKICSEIPLSYRYIKDLACSKTIKWSYYDLRKDMVKVYSPTAHIDGSPVIYLGVEASKRRLKSLEWEQVRELLN